MFDQGWISEFAATLCLVGLAFGSTAVYGASI